MVRGCRLLCQANSSCCGCGRLRTSLPSYATIRCREPGRRRYRVSVKQEVNGKGSTFLHTHIKDGDVLDVSAPRGKLHPAARRRTGGAAERRHRRDTGDGNAARPGGQPSPRAIWWLYGRVMRPSIPLPAKRAILPPCCRTSEASSPTASQRRRPARRRLRCTRTADPRRAGKVRRAARGRLLLVRPCGLPAKLHPGPAEIGRRTVATAPGGVRPRRGDHAGNRSGWLRSHRINR